MPLNVFMFLISHFTPSLSVPAGRTDEFTSQRKCPISRLQSLIPA